MARSEEQNRQSRERARESILSSAIELFAERGVFVFERCVALRIVLLQQLQQRRLDGLLVRIVAAEDLYLIHPKLVGGRLRERGNGGGKGENNCFHLLP